MSWKLNAFAFVAIWQGFIMPFIAGITDVLQMFCALLGVIAGLMTVYYKYRNNSKNGKK